MLDELVKDPAQCGLIHKGKAGELGRRRIGIEEFLKDGLSPTAFFAFTLLFLVSDSSGNNQLALLCQICRCWGTL